MEAEIYSNEGISNVKKAITDIDVLALVPSNSGNFEMILGDCKTLKNQSPISRALWMKGLMSWMNAGKGIILLDKKIEQDHKLAASNVNVNLLSESDFEKYATCTSSNYKTVESAICSPDIWEEYYNIYTRFPNLKTSINFVKNDFWNKFDYRIKLRHTLLAIREIKNELNPDHPIHLMLLTDYISLFSIAISYAVCDIFNQYLLPESKDQLSENLKILIWGGIESYKYYNSLYNMVSHAPNSDLRLPEWDSFIQLIRQCLEQPYATSEVPLILREIAFEFTNKEKSTWMFSSKLAGQNLQAAKFALLISEYFCLATKIPPEFKSIITKRLLEIQM